MFTSPVYFANRLYRRLARRTATLQLRIAISCHEVWYYYILTADYPTVPPFVCKPIPLHKEESNSIGLSLYHHPRRDSLLGRRSWQDNGTVVEIVAFCKPRIITKERWTQKKNAPLIHRGASSVDADVGPRTIRKLDWRFLLLLVIVVFLAYADRSNIGYAARDLCNELNLTNEEYGLGVSLFYIGYLLTQVIGNVLLKRIGAPLWISFIVFFWGIVATTLGFIQNATQFYVLRVLLGVAEGGTFPAIWYIIPMFYPAEHITNAYSVIFSAIAFSMPLSSPISAGLLSLGPAVGVEGWRLLFIVEGLTPIFYTLYFYFSFPPSLQEASFLNAEEKDWIASRQEKEERVTDVSDWEEIKAVLTHGPWRTCSLCFLILFGIYTGLMFWATLIIHEMLYGDDDDDDDDDSKTCGSKHGNAAIAVLMTAIPYLMSGLACLLTRRYEVRNRSRLAAIMFGLSGVLLFSWVGTGHAPFGIRFVLLTLIISLSFVVSAYVTGLMMALSKVSAQSAAASLYNMIGTVGAVVFPLIFGKLLDVVGSEVAMVFPGGLSFVGALLMLTVKDPSRTE